jgi:hypothetical protein
LFNGLLNDTVSSAGIYRIILEELGKTMTNINEDSERVAVRTTAVPED